MYKNFEPGLELVSQFHSVCNPQDDNEPEFGILIDTPSDMRAIHERIIATGSFYPLPHGMPRETTLLSFALHDKSDPKKNHPSLSERMGWEFRRRCNIDNQGKIAKCDMSAKTLGKDFDRDEVEEPTASLSNVALGFKTKLEEKDANFKGISIDKLAVACLVAASRMPRYYAQPVQTLGALIEWEVNNDWCHMANADATSFLGKRLEVEPEIVRIRCSDNRYQNDAQFIAEARLAGQEEMEKAVCTASYLGDFRLATSSKCSDAVYRVRVHNESQKHLRSQCGIYTEMTKGISASDVVIKYKDNLLYLLKSMPTPNALDQMLKKKLSLDLVDANIDTPSHLVYSAA